MKLRFTNVVHNKRLDVTHGSLRWEGTKVVCRIPVGSVTSVRKILCSGPDRWDECRCFFEDEDIGGIRIELYGAGAPRRPRSCKVDGSCFLIVF